jgi:crotonobetainyl-CoA:carnitine CoA-transferase CaiB-like acyl-CoA transferase
MQRPPSPEDDLSTPTAEPRNQRRLPLDGIRILDLTSVVVGPACTARLAQFGANIIKVESPEGDLMRTLGGQSPTGQHSGAYLHLNRGKRNICIDLKNAVANEVIDRLLAWADVVITNMRPGALKRLGLDAASARATRPRLIHCLISGYGTDGPYAGEPAYDSVLQGVSGIAGLLGARSGTAEYVPLLLCDHVTGEIAAGAVMAAIIERQTTGQGSSLEVPMFETMAAFVLQEHLARRSFDPPLGPPGDPRLLTPHNRPVETADGAVSVDSRTPALAEGTKWSGWRSAVRPFVNERRPHGSRHSRPQTFRRSRATAWSRCLAMPTCAMSASSTSTTIRQKAPSLRSAPLSPSTAPTRQRGRWRARVAGTRWLYSPRSASATARPLI